MWLLRWAGTNVEGVCVYTVTWVRQQGNSYSAAATGLALLVIC